MLTPEAAAGPPAVSGRVAPTWRLHLATGDRKMILERGPVHAPDWLNKYIAETFRQTCQNHGFSPQKLLKYLTSKGNSFSTWPRGRLKLSCISGCGLPSPGTLQQRRPPTR